MTSVLVVDDSQFMRTVVGNILADYGYDVRSAADGREAIERVAEHDPDIVTMDVEMPEVDGIEATERIMARDPRPILMVSAHTEDGADATLEALQRGAVDFLTKEREVGTTDIPDLETRLIEKIRALEVADVSTIAPSRAAAAAHAASGAAARSAGAASAGSGGATARSDSAGAGTPSKTGPRTGSEHGTDAEPAAAPDVEAERSFVEHPTVVLGASTGGPKVLERVLRDLPASLPARVLVVQHMPESFTGRLAARLDHVLPFDVAEASEGARVGDGEVLVARGDHHTAVTGASRGRLRVTLTRDDRRHSVRPAIDVTMETAAEHARAPLCGVLLTGMGKDGAAGAEAIRSAGGHAIAQDEATSPVFGIPRNAIQAGAIDDVLPASSIGDRLLDLFTAEDDGHG